MILAPLASAPKYVGVHKSFRDAFAWLERMPPGLAPGRYPIDGEWLYASVDEAATQPRGERRFETHRRYTDIQVELAGGEYIEWAPGDLLPIAEDFAPGGDIAFHRAPATPATALRLEPGWFAVFFPGEAHRPLCALETGPARVRKVVLKLDLTRP